MSEGSTTPPAAFVTADESNPVKPELIRAVCAKTDSYLQAFVVNKMKEIESQRSELTKIIDSATQKAFPNQTSGSELEDYLRGSIAKNIEKKLEDLKDNSSDDQETKLKNRLDSMMNRLKAAEKKLNLPSECLEDEASTSRPRNEKSNDNGSKNLSKIKKKKSKKDKKKKSHKKRRSDSSVSDGDSRSSSCTFEFRRPRSRSGSYSRYDRDVYDKNGRSDYGGSYRRHRDKSTSYLRSDSHPHMNKVFYNYKRGRYERFEGQDLDYNPRVQHLEPERRDRRRRSPSFLKGKFGRGDSVERKYHRLMRDRREEDEQRERHPEFQTKLLPTDKTHDNSDDDIMQEVNKELEKQRRKLQKAAAEQKLKENKIREQKSDVEADKVDNLSSAPICSTSKTEDCQDVPDAAFLVTAKTANSLSIKVSDDTQKFITEGKLVIHRSETPLSEDESMEPKSSGFGVIQSTVVHKDDSHKVLRSPSHCSSDGALPDSDKEGDKKTKEEGDLDVKFVRDQKKHRKKHHRMRSDSRSTARSRLSKRSRRHHRHRSSSSSSNLSTEDYKRVRPRSPTIDSHERRLNIDKKQLRRRAIINTIRRLKNGRLDLSDGVNMTDLASIKAGGIETAELTEVCQKISDRQNKLREKGMVDEDIYNLPYFSDDEELEEFIRHPFQVKERTDPCISIRNSRSIPIQTPAEKLAQKSQLNSAFPVSSGKYHYEKDQVWIPADSASELQQKLAGETHQQLAIEAAVGSSSCETPQSDVALGDAIMSAAGSSSTSNITTAAQAATAIATKPPVLQQPALSAEPQESISDILTQRISAMRKLTENPNDSEAMSKVFEIQEKMNQWATSAKNANVPKNTDGSLPSGEFTGVAEFEPMSQSDHNAGYQAWYKKEQFMNAKPITGGIGQYLLQKMGWKSGQGLGRNNEGALEPLNIDYKVDRKGLASTTEKVNKPFPGTRGAVIKDVGGRHPISALLELSKRRKWGNPDFALVHESGPSHSRNFLYAVRVNGVDYQPTIASRNKKDGKAAAATVALQELGVVAKD